jgi:rhamnulokinase
MDHLKMKNPSHFLACDLGAESGRVIAGTLEGGVLSLKEIHRFANVPLRVDGSLCWNFPNLILEIKEGLRKAAATGFAYSSISADSWGVDYVLFNARGDFMPPVFHYRDQRTLAGMERVFARVEQAQIFAETGIQHMPINTIFQLAAEPSERLEGAALLLGVGDAVNFYLSGHPAIEASMASTFQLYNPRERAWSEKLIGKLDLPRRLFPEIVPAGARLGPLRAELARELCLPGMEVLATCSHDTGAAVAGVPAEGEHWAYLSSGTWSLLGVELSEPVINENSRELNFTNEIGFGQSVRLLKNISGLWLAQECKRQWASQGREFDYITLTELAGRAEAFVSLINPAAPEFLSPRDMPLQIAEFCRRTGQPVPVDEGAFMRCILESLALLYKRTLAELERLIGNRIERLHIVGGGSQNNLLNQFASNATGLPVLAGPSEATAIGNILIQAIATGQLDSLAEARRVARSSARLKEFFPADLDRWKAAARRFEEFL